MSERGSAELVVVSNRGPYSFVPTGGGYEAREGGGGLAPSLASALKASAGHAVWVAAAMSEADRSAIKAGVVEAAAPDGLGLRLADIPADTYRAAYDVVANATLWFLVHGLFDASRRPLIDRRWHDAWDGFRAYNEAFAAEVAEVASDNARVLINDYHLALVGGVLAKTRPDLATVHFTHTPFGSPSEMGMLPASVLGELIGGLAAPATGFHSTRWESEFVSCAAALDIEAGLTFHEPLGPDADRLRAVAGSAACAERLAALDKRLGDRRLVVRSDRIELSKNILRGLIAFDTLLEDHPEWRGEVVHLVRVYPSREGLAEYLAYRSEIEHLAAVINAKWAKDGYEPVWLDVDDDFASTVAALVRYDVLLVNPLRDGMNLVAKEGPVVNERDGVLILSERAGAWDQLGPACIGVNPFDVSATAEALHTALSLDGVDRAEQAGRLRDLAVANPPGQWLQAVLSRA